MRVRLRLALLHRYTKVKSESENWLQYRDTFSSLIVDNARITEIEKFHYLQATLEGNVNEIIANLDISAANFEIAWKSVCERYNNTNLMVHNHVKSLFDLHPMRKQSHKELRLLIDTITKNLRSLSAFEQPTNQWDKLLLYIVGTKLNATTTREWEQNKPSDKLPWENMKITCRFVRNVRNKESKSEKVASFKQAKPVYSKSNTSLVSTSETSVFCKGAHAIINCERFRELTVNARVENVKKLNLCSNCLRAGHFASQCRSPKRCFVCKQNHNTLLHYQRTRDVEPQKRVEETTNCGFSTQNNEILLSTALIDVQSINGTESYTCKAILILGRSRAS